MAIRNNFKILLALKEDKDDRSYTYEDIYELTGIAPGTLVSYAKGRVSRFDGDTLIRLCDFLECTLDQLIQYPPTTGQKMSGETVSNLLAATP